MRADFWSTVYRLKKTPDRKNTGTIFVPYKNHNTVKQTKYKKNRKMGVSNANIVL